MTSSTYPTTFDGLMQLVTHLRGPEGCPWDREQTRASMRSNVREESHELLDAIDEDDAAKLVEELGDVLFHVAFQVLLGIESGEFTEKDVFGAVIAKLVRRHPHVFADADVSDSDEVLSRWHAIKRQERSDEGGSVLDGVPRSLPALAHAQTVQHRAARVGFDWDDLDGVIDKVKEEVDELRAADDQAKREAEVGDLLFSLVNVCRWMETDAETALRESSGRFQQRFERMERTSAERGLRFEDLPLDDKEALWQEAKTQVS
jgi:tetrapyrrole methylase family protein/MazG family protein